MVILSADVMARKLGFKQISSMEMAGKCLLVNM